MTVDDGTGGARQPASMFAAVWGGQDTPYPFQEQVTELLARGERVLLRAPTGAGKTRAALTAFLYNRRYGSLPAMPRRCLYAVPMRVLATQFHGDLGGQAQAAGVEPRIQTGEQQDARRLEGGLTFLTIDQLLSSFLTMPYSLPYRLANLNAGALVGSYLVLDEFHLYDPNTTLVTTLEMLRRLRDLGPMLAMTATFSGRMLGVLAEMLRAEVVTVDADEVRTIETCWGEKAPRRRTWRVAEGPLTAEAVLAAHQPGTRTLVVCNRVEPAQALYEALRKKHSRTVLLHSRFLPEDRKRHEQSLRDAFKQNVRSDMIAVATQVVEVGLDISAVTLHTDLAPAAALIQRAGRCARRPGEEGTVWVYPVDNYRPYAGKPDDPTAVEMVSALAWLRENDGQVLTFVEEQAFIDAACGERDEILLQGLRSGESLKREQIAKALSGDRVAREATELVRDADSRRLLIHDRPEELLRAPYGASGFGVHPTVLLGAYSEWGKRAQELGVWAVKRLADGGDEGESGHSRLSWTEVTEAKQLLGSGVVVVNAELAGYDPDQGLLLKEKTGFRSTLPAQSEAVAGTKERPGYKAEPYLEHVQRVLAALSSEVLPEMVPAMECLERVAGWQAGLFLKAAWLVCALHDVGKLARKWQKWARNYQKAIGQPTDGLLAHTCYDAQNPLHCAGQKAAGARPSHAPEGAVACTPLLVRRLRDESIVRAAWSAIARHHGPFTEVHGEFDLQAEAVEAVRASLRLLPAIVEGIDKEPQLLLSSQQAPSGGLAVRPQRNAEWLAYALLVRALRMADQAGTAAALE